MSLSEIQKAIHVAKDKTNDFGGYNYRTAEGILAAAKAVMPEGASIILSDELTEMAGHMFIKSVAVLAIGKSSHSAVGFAMHPITKKGMDPSQITGSASSYARKYALCGLLAIDDSAGDPDASEKPYEPEPFDAPAARDRLKGAVEKQDTQHNIDALWAQSSFQSIFDQLPQPMQNEIKKAKADQEDNLKEKK